MDVDTRNATDTSTAEGSPDPSRPVGYIMSRFPKLTETFVLYEILSLQRQGVPVEIYPLHRERCRVVHPEAAPLVARARFSRLLSLAVLWSNAAWLLRRPAAYLGAWGTCLRATWGSRRYFLGVLAVVPLAAHIARRMRQDGVGHVHAHFASHPAAAALVVSRLTGLPYSFTAHGSDLHREHRMLREKVSEAAFVAAISQFNRQWILDRCGEQVGDKVHVIHCGVSPEQFGPEQHRPESCGAGPGEPADMAGGEAPAPQATPAGASLEQAPLQIVCIGTLHEVKGQAHLLRACGELRRRGIPFRLHLVGDGPDGEMLRRLAADESIGEQVDFHGALPRPDVLARLAAADVAVAPSVVSSDGRREGIPVVLMEAMASRLPVVASRLSGIPELVIDEETGLLTPPGEAGALADALCRLAADPALRRRLGEAGWERVGREFHLDKESRRLAVLFGALPPAAPAASNRSAEDAPSTRRPPLEAPA